MSERKKTITTIKNIMSIHEISNLPINDFQDCIASVCSVVCKNNGVDVEDIYDEILDFFGEGRVFARINSDSIKIN